MRRFWMVLTAAVFVMAVLPGLAQDGVPVDAAEEAVAQRYTPLWNECVQGITAGKHGSAETALTCRRAADTAAEFAADKRFIEKRAADVYAATALANGGDFVAGLRYANRAVDIVKLGHDDNSGVSAAYATRGTIEAMLNNWSAADADMTIGEDFERKAIAAAAKEKQTAMLANYKRVLAKSLVVHASVLRQMNHMADAQAKLEEAGRLQ